MKKYYFFILSAFLLSACGGEAPKEEQAATEKSSALNCIYTYDHSSTKVSWVAYKFQEKTPVGGNMDSVIVNAPTETADNLFDALNGLALSVITKSVNSNDADRDPKLRADFFGKMKNTEIISGAVKSVSGDGNQGIMTLVIRMNEVEKEVSGELSVNGESVEMRTTINLEDWNANAAVESLHEVCLEKHKGQDGGSKLWSEVMIVISTTLNKSCE